METFLLAVILALALLVTALLMALNLQLAREEGGDWDGIGPEPARVRTETEAKNDSERMAR